jgi:hypothetical protein
MKMASRAGRAGRRMRRRPNSSTTIPTIASAWRRLCAAGVSQRHPQILFANLVLERQIGHCPSSTSKVKATPSIEPNIDRQYGAVFAPFYLRVSSSPVLRPQPAAGRSRPLDTPAFRRTISSLMPGRRGGQPVAAASTRSTGPAHHARGRRKRKTHAGIDIVRFDTGSLHETWFVRLTRTACPIARRPPEDHLMRLVAGIAIAHPAA